MVGSGTPTPVHSKAWRVLPAQGAVMVVGSLVPFLSTSLVVRVSCVKATTPHLCLVLIMSSDDLKSHICTFAHQPWRRRRPTSLPRLEPGWLQALQVLCPVAAPTCMFLMHRPEPSCCPSLRSVRSYRVTRRGPVASCLFRVTV